MQANHRRDGFALALTLVFTLVLTGGVLTAMNQVSNERKVADSQSAGLAAFTLAEAGLEQALEAWSSAGAPPDNGTSIRIDLADGYADVTVNQMLQELADEPAIYVIRSRGVHAQGGWAGAPEAARTVAQLATWTTGDMDIRAGWVGLNGLHKKGSSGTVSGKDACGLESMVAGVAVPDGGYDQDGGSWEDVLVGEPLVDEMGATAEEVAAGVDIDWDGIVEGTALQPDLTIPPADNWPSFSEDPDYWPIIYVDNEGGDFSVPGSGRGTLIVRGDVTFGGGVDWDGVVLVGGAMTLNGQKQIMGAAISGLNIMLDEAEHPAASWDESDVGNGNITVQFDSCAVESAMQRFGGFQVYENTWVDNWAMY